MTKPFELMVKICAPQLHSLLQYSTNNTIMGTPMFHLQI